ncbi:ATP synthase subunit delta [Rhodococcoides trifolii]|uniref:ATP synthase subunit delta n=1 Tax=Rhodococcoides trifolii TaxID=908250 RepID=A0A917CWV7_9NOCA|nr:F0F1 ATP synthase subunit delta [Rhodococcus trifolii]GGG01139.1 ATP synthase subunit delta [Rhodococcus trifolii]
MYAASREALSEAREALGSALDSVSAGEATAAAAQTGAELFSVVSLLDGQRPLRNALADASASSEARTALADKLFGGKVGEPTLAVLRIAAGRGWSVPRDMTDSLVRLGQESLLRAADDQDQLDTVEDELFRLGRIVAGNASLEQALSDRSKPASAVQELLSKLLYGKVTAITEALAKQAVGRLREAPAEAIDALSHLAADRRQKAVALVRSATELTSEQVDRLGTTLEGIYGKPVTVHVEIDRELLSGLVVRVGDEVIDGSGAGRLAALRKTLK